jgi:predicted MFS family arabinose efflux permease
VFILVGIGNVASWTIAMSITMEFVPEAERPAYIGLANTLVAPAALFATLFGGWLADTSGFKTTFATAAAFSLVALTIFWMLRDPRHNQGKITSNDSGESVTALEN